MSERTYKARPKPAPAQEKKIEEEVTVVTPDPIFPEPEKVEVTEEVMVEEVKPEPKPEPAKIGKIVKCERLNVRERAYGMAKIICTVDKGSEVTILDEPDASFYKVRLKSGIEGFCVRHFIEIV